MVWNSEDSVIATPDKNYIWGCFKAKDPRNLLLPLERNHSWKWNQGNDDFWIHLDLDIFSSIFLTGAKLVCWFVYSTYTSSILEESRWTTFWGSPTNHTPDTLPLQVLISLHQETSNWQRKPCKGSGQRINAAHRAGVDEVIDGNLDVKSFCRYRFMILLKLRPAFCLPTLICLPTMGFFQAISTVDFLTDLARRSWSSRMSPLWWSSATDQVVLVVDTMNLIPKSPMGWFHSRKLTSTAVLQSLSCIEMWIKTNMIPLWTEYYSLLGQWLTFKTFWDYIFI